MKKRQFMEIGLCLGLNGRLWTESGQDTDRCGTG